MLHIIFDNSQRQLTLDELLRYLRDKCELSARMSEWVFAGQSVPQIHVQTSPPIALQLNEDPSYVPEEIADLLDSVGDELDERSRAIGKKCRSRIEVESCEPHRIHQFPEGGILISSPEVDLDAPDVQAVLLQVTAFLDGLCHDNVNGRWIKAI